MGAILIFSDGIEPSNYTKHEHCQSMHPSKWEFFSSKKGRFYIAQYPVRWTVQSTLHVFLNNPDTQEAWNYES